MKKWTVVVPRKNDYRASTLFRFLQLEAALGERGHALEFVTPDGFRGDDSSRCGVILQKILPSRMLWRELEKSGKPIVADFDDAVWHGSGGEGWRWKDVPRAFRKRQKLRVLLKRCKMVTVANWELGGFLGRKTNVRVVPMSLDPLKWTAKTEWGEKFVVGWAGAPNNLPMLKELEGEIGCFLRYNPDAVFVVCCGEKPELDFPFEFIPHGESTLPASIRRFSVGLVPLPQNKFAMGKSPIKALQYMAGGIPMIATPHPGLSEMVGGHPGVAFARKLGDWNSSLCFFKKYKEQLPEMGRWGRRRFERFFTTQTVSRGFSEILDEVDRLGKLMGQRRASGRGDAGGDSWKLTGGVLHAI